MQGIPFFHFKTMYDCLCRLQAQAEYLQLPVEEIRALSLQKENLQEIYRQYEVLLQQVALVVKQYDVEQKSVRRLISNHKRNSKAYLKKGILGKTG
ncbi:MAG TPA: hypothetical protein PLC48_06615 [Ferruginibacter sp.]|nr:hypothetical protein [Ferruginibacter sp.]